MAGKHITHSLGLEKNESEEDWSWGISILHSITASAPLTARASAVFPSSYSSCSSSSSSLTHVEEVLSEDEEDLSWNQESKLEFMDLPREVHLAMLQHLSPTELLKLSRVSRYWQNLAFDGSLWIRVDMSPHHRFISSRQLTTIFKTSGYFVRFINLRGCYSATGGVIKTLALHCPNLEEINLSGCRRISSLQLEQLIDTSPHLKRVDLSGLFSVTAGAIEALARVCPKLEKANLAWCKHTSNDSILKLVTSCTKLISLNLNGCSSLKADALRRIGQLPQLQHLSLSRCSHLGDGEFFILSEGRLGNLTHLNLANVTQLSDLALGSIVRRRPPLTWLDISGCNMISETGFQVLAEGFRGLKYLGADSCPRITDRTLRRLGNSLLQLERISLGGCEGITDPGIYALLRGCKLLTRLELDNCPNITDAMLRCLTSWIPNKLTSLDVFDCRNLSHRALQDVGRERPSLDIRSFYSGFNLSQQNHRHLFEGYDSDSGSGCLIL